MKQFYLTEIVTKDKLIHQGIYFEPKIKGKRALLFVHGLTSTFYAHIPLFDAVADAGEKAGIGFASFNNRGHDLIAGIKKVDRRKKKGYSRINGGAGYERFEDCLYDIDAGIDFLVGQGFTEIVLVGHSTGANKVCYYAGKKQNKFVKGVVLLSPTSDRLVSGESQEKRKKDLNNMNRFMVLNKGDELVLGCHFFPLTPKRYLSIFASHSNEDMFDYGDDKPTMKYYSQIKKPLLIIFGEQDELADRPVEQIKNVFDTHTRSIKYKSLIIPGALHSFNGKEREVVATIIDWVGLL